MKRLAILLIMSSLCGLVLAQDNPPKPAGDQAQTPGNRREGGFRFQAVTGVITAINRNQLSLRTSDGKDVTVNLSSDTRYRRDRQPAALADFKVGDTVMIGGNPAGENTWNARFVATRGDGAEQMPEGLGKRFIAGEIKSIDGAHLTILRVDGETQTIAVDENTSFRKQGESITLGDFKPGDHVYGRGELKDGTFVAAVLNAGDPRTGPPSGASPDRH